MADSKAFMTKGLSVLDGTLGVLNTAISAGQYRDTSQYEAQLQDMSNRFGNNYYDNDAVIQDMLNMPTGFNVSEDDLNPTLGQSVGRVGTGALQGASAGMAFGPWGALAGAVIGGGATLLGDLYGKQGNQYKASTLNYNQGYQQKMNSLAMNTAADQAHDYQFGQAWKMRKAAGGKIERKEQTIQEFADRVLKRQRTSDITHSAGIVRQHCNGGTMIRIKMK